MSYENNWYYENQRARKTITEQFNWDKFAEGLVGPKNYRPKLSCVKNVGIPYKIVSADSSTYNPEQTIQMAAVKGGNLNSAARTIFKENYEGIKREYEFVSSKYNKALPNLIEEINTYSERLDTNEDLDDLMDITLQRFMKTGELKETFKNLAKSARGNPSSLKQKGEDGKTQVENFVEDFTKLLNDSYAYTGGKEGFLSLDSDLATKLKRYEEFSEKVLGGTVTPGDINALAGHIWKLFSAPMEAIGGYVVAEFMDEFYDEMAQVVGGAGTDKVAQGKRDIAYGSLGISAKNYLAKKSGSVGTITYHSGDLSKLLADMGWTTQLQVLYAYANATKDASLGEFRTLVEAVISSVAIAGFPGDRVHLMLYVNKAKPVYEYFEREGTNVSVKYDTKSVNMDSLYNIIRTRQDIKLIGGEVKSRSRGGKFK